MPDRDELKHVFLAKTKWKDASRLPLSSDASGRSYDRLDLDGKTAMLMDAPYEVGEDIRPFLQVTDYLRDFDLSPPQILARDIENGFLLLEDFGDDLFAEICRNQSQLERTLYEAAIDVLIHLHKFECPDLEPYDLRVCLREARLVTEWYIPGTTGKNQEDSFCKEYDQIILQTCNQIKVHTPVLVMRDYHAENLIWLSDRDGPRRVGLLDYQDALAGHPSYDLLSLLEDARRDTSAKLRRDMIDRYLEATEFDREDFMEAYFILAAQRNLKIIGIFARLGTRDGKKHYIDMIPRVWDHLQRDLEHPSCHALKCWVEENLKAPTIDVLETLRQANA